MESADLFEGKPAESILWNGFKYGRMGRHFIGTYTECTFKVTIYKFNIQTQEMGNV